MSATGARHRAPREQRATGRIWLAALLVLALVVGVIIFFLVRDNAGESAADQQCPGPDIELAVTPELADVITEGLEHAGCDQVELTEVDSATMSQQLLTGDRAPDVWIPDSSLWAQRAAGDNAPEVIVPSLASSPVVLVTGKGTPPLTWAEALADDAWLMGDPLASVAAIAPLLAVEAEGDREKTTALLVPLAQARAGMKQAAATDDERLARLVDGDAGVTSVSEQRQLAQAPALRSAVPEVGTLFLDYPVVLTAADDRREEIEESVSSLVAALQGSEMQTDLRGAGFRAADRKPTQDDGVAATVLTVEEGQAAATLEQWATLALPTRSLAVVDVSGSMDFDAGGQTRMELTTAATQGGLGLFPDASAIGLWAFSHRLEGEQDHRELVPIRALGETVDGTSQRDLLDDGLAGLGDLTGGSTGLYDTTLAAYEAMLADYDPEAVNSVLLFTDGANEDPGSITLTELLDRLVELADPGRPVRIVAIGISDDADAEALQEIAAATGGQAYVARDPQDMATVFQQALGARS